MNMSEDRLCRWPLYCGGHYATPSVTPNYSTPKKDYIEQKLQVIAEIEKRIAELQRSMCAIKDKKSEEYKSLKKKVEKYQTKIKECRDSIRNISEQLNIIARTEKERAELYAARRRSLAR